MNENDARLLIAEKIYLQCFNGKNESSITQNSETKIIHREIASSYSEKEKRAPQL